MSEGTPVRWKHILLFLRKEKESLLLEKELLQRGYKVTAVFSSEGALLKSSSVKYDIVVMEIDPRDDLALSLPRVIKKKSPETRIFVLGSPSSGFSPEKFQAVGVESVLSGIEDLRRVVFSRLPQ